MNIKRSVATKIFWNIKVVRKSTILTVHVRRCVCRLRIHPNLEMRVFTHHSTTSLAYGIVEIDPVFICLSVPLTWTTRVKQSYVKCKEQRPNVSLGAKFFRYIHTHLFHFVRTLPLAEEVCIEIPNSLSDCGWQLEKKALRISLTSYILHTKVPRLF